MYTAFPKSLRWLAKMQATPQDRNRHGVQGDVK